jgi:small subunit ribosomal protein S17
MRSEMIQEDVRGDRKVRQGVVVSNKMNKTVVVRVSRSVAHKKYGKVVSRSSKCYAHNEIDGVNEGDEVMIMETRPLSKTKRWRVLARLEKSA